MIDFNNPSGQAMSSPRSRAALTSCAITARSAWVAVDEEDRFFGSFGIELTPVIVSVVGDQPSPPATPACRAGNTVHRTAPKVLHSAA